MPSTSPRRSVQNRENNLRKVLRAMKLRLRKSPAKLRETPGFGLYHIENEQGDMEAGGNLADPYRMSLAEAEAWATKKRAP